MDSKHDGAQQPPENRLARKRRAEKDPLHSESKIPYLSEQQAEINPLQSESEIPSQSQQKAEENPLKSESEIPSQSQQKAEENPLQSESQTSSSSEQQPDAAHLNKVPLSEAETVAKEATSEEGVLEEPLPQRNYCFVFNTAKTRRFFKIIAGPLDHIIINKFNMPIYRRDILTIMPGSWLNDTIINFHLKLIMERSDDPVRKLPTVHAYNTYFLRRLLSRGYQAVRGWTRNVDVLGKDILLIPVKHNAEVRCMVIIDLRKKTIRYYDSTLQTNPIPKSVFESYLKMESMDKRNQPLDTTEFKFEAMKNIPKQDNIYDAGPFSLMFAEYITRDNPITFGQNNMEFIRAMMIMEVGCGKLCR